MNKRVIPMTCQQVDLLCDECGETMKYTGYSRPVSPAQYHHACSNNHTQWVVGITFPHIEHIPAPADWRKPMVTSE